MEMLEFLKTPPRHLFFTGKGGVGKTSIACACAIALAERGRRVLLVSTDPASNLDEVLGIALATEATAIPSVPGLFALNLDPEAAAHAYRDRMVGPYRGKLPPMYLAQMEEQLSGACTVEIAAFDEFSKLIGDPAATAGFDHVLFDTAPTGHTLRLLSLPSAWRDFADTNTSGASCIGPLAGLKEQRALYGAAIRALSDKAQTVVVLVSRLDAAALAEASRTSAELGGLQIENQFFVLNGVFRTTATDDPIAAAFDGKAQQSRARMPANLARLPGAEIALSGRALVGVEALRGLFGKAEPTALLERAETVSGTGTDKEMAPPLGSLIDDLARAGHGVVMTMGKGGVGKTTVAAAIAIELSRRGHRVHLTTTDPAAHVAAMVGSAPEEWPAGLSVSRIDPVAETRAYVDEVLRTAGAGLDAAGRALLEEDLRSPCTEEVAVFRAFARTVAEGQSGFVVVDTAPTGHTILLLDATEAYHREVSRQGSAAPDAVKNLLPRLRDPEFTHIVIVTLPEATPVHEAERLQQDLARAGIRTFAWVINQSLTPCQTHDPILAARRRAELPYIAEVTERLAQRVALIGWKSTAPVGIKGLQALLSKTGEPKAISVNI